MGIAYSAKSKTNPEHDGASAKLQAPDLSSFKTLPCFKLYSTMPASAISNAYSEYRRSMFPPALDARQFERIANIASPDMAYPDIVDQFRQLQSRTGKVSAMDFFAGVTLICRDSIVLKLRLLYRLFDARQIKSLCYDETVLLLASTMRGYCSIKNAPAPTLPGIECVADDVFGKDINKSTGRVSLAEFTRWCKQAGPLLFLLEGLDASSSRRNQLMDAKTDEQKRILQQLAKVEAALHAHLLVPLDPKEYLYDTDGTRHATNSTSMPGRVTDDSGDGATEAVWVGVSDESDFKSEAFPITTTLTCMMATYLEIPNNLDNIPFHSDPSAICDAHVDRIRHQVSISLEVLELIGTELKQKLFASHQLIDSFWESSKKCWPCTSDYFGYKLNLNSNWKGESNTRTMTGKIDEDIRTKEEIEAHEKGHKCSLISFLRWVKDVELVVGKARESNARNDATSDGNKFKLGGEVTTGRCSYFESIAVSSLFKWMLAEEISRLQRGKALVNRKWDETVNVGSCAHSCKVMKGITQVDWNQGHDPKVQKSCSDEWIRTTQLEVTVGTGSHKPKSFVDASLPKVVTNVFASTQNKAHQFDSVPLGQSIVQDETSTIQTHESREDDTGQLNLNCDESQDSSRTDSSDSSSQGSDDDDMIDVSLLLYGEALYNQLVVNSDWKSNNEDCGGYCAFQFELKSNLKSNIAKAAVKLLQDAFSNAVIVQALSDYVVGVHVRLSGSNRELLECYVFWSTTFVETIEHFMMVTPWILEFLRSYSEAIMKIEIVNGSLEKCGDSEFRNLMLWENQACNNKGLRRRSTKRLNSVTQTRRQGLAVGNKTPARSSRRVSSIITPPVLSNSNVEEFEAVAPRMTSNMKQDSENVLTKLGTKLLNRVFDLFDVNRDNVLDLYEMNVMQQRLGGIGFSSHQEYCRLVEDQRLPCDDNGNITREGFNKLYIQSDQLNLSEDLWLVGVNRFRGELQYQISGELTHHPSTYELRCGGNNQTNSAPEETEKPESLHTTNIQFELSCLADSMDYNRGANLLSIPGVLSCQFRALGSVIRNVLDWMNTFNPSALYANPDVAELIAYFQLIDQVVNALRPVIQDLNVIRFSTASGIFVSLAMKDLDILLATLFEL